MKEGRERLIVASNRLPVAVSEADGVKRLEAGAGGLVTALTPIMDKRRGVWIGWPGMDESCDVVSSLIEDFNGRRNYSLVPVALTAEQVQRYYHGFSNETLWPVFHDMIGHARFDRENWLAYVEVNKLFAREVARIASPGDFIWIHDYHLLLVGKHLRELGAREPLSYFLHIPFPSYDLFRRLPWKREILDALLQFDLIGVQTMHDHRNFVQTVRAMKKGIKVVFKTRTSFMEYEGRTVKVGHFPISIDFREFSAMASSREVAQVAEVFKKGFHAATLLLGVDRLDYTKGIPHRFLAFERALEKYPELKGKVSLFQLMIPSRTEVPEYQHIKDEIDRLVGRINGHFSRDGWVPIFYRFGTLNHRELVGRYRACDIALITPERDGMNLVAKEYCASQTDNNGVLILSEFAGAAERLSNGALIINPYDVEATADAIHTAYHMPQREKMRRMGLLRAEIKRNDVYQWLDWILESFQDQRRQHEALEHAGVGG